MTLSDQIQAVFEAHPLEADDGAIVCRGCHWVLGDPGWHLLDALLAVLDPDYQPQATPPKPEIPDRRESQIRWEESA